MKCYSFGQKVIPLSHSFLETKLSYAFVNLMPLIPGHVLVCPQRIVEKFEQLNPDEVADLFQTAQKVSKAVVKYFNGTSCTLAVQKNHMK